MLRKTSNVDFEKAIPRISPVQPTYFMNQIYEVNSSQTQFQKDHIIILTSLMEEIIFVISIEQPPQIELSLDLPVL